MDARLVFLCGFPSSGTDLLKNIVNAHSDISICGEFPFLPGLAKKYASKVPASVVEDLVAEFKKLDVYHNFRNPNFKPTKLEKKSEYSLSEIYSYMLTDSQVKWKGNKTPQNTENMDKLRFLFPQAKFILIVRDIRDVSLSFSKKWGKDKFLCAAKWNSRMQKGLQLLNTLDEPDFLIIKYEKILDDLDKVASQICRFLNIEYQDSMINYHQYVNEIVEGKINYGKALIKENSEKWRQEMSQIEIKRIEEIAFPSLTLFGYPITSATEYIPITNIEKYYGVVHDIYSLIFVGNRAQEEANNLFARFKTVLFEIKKCFSILSY